MFLKKPKVVFYDFDETLVTSKEVYKKSLNLLCEKYGIPKRTDEDMKVINGSDFKTVLSALFGAENEEKIHQEYEFGYNIYSNNLCHPISGALEFVQNINKQNIQQAIISNKPDHIIAPEVQRLGFGKYINTIVGSSCGYKKPSKQLLYIALERLNMDKNAIDNEKIWMFGDSIPDVEFAQNINAEMFFVGNKNILSSELNNYIKYDWTSFYDIHFLKEDMNNKPRQTIYY